jgi:hypothetical protein
VYLLAVGWGNTGSALMMRGMTYSHLLVLVAVTLGLAGFLLYDAYIRFGPKSSLNRSLGADAPDRNHILKSCIYLIGACFLLIFAAYLIK